MRIVIFGAGSLGCALGALLSRANELALVGRRANMSAIRKGGLRIVGDIDLRVKLDARETIDELKSPDLLIIATKAYDTLSAIDACKGWAEEDAMVLTLQNGLGNLEAIREWKGKKAFGGTITMGANLLEPAKVRLSGLGRTIIGSDLNPSGARRIVTAFSNSGIPTFVKNEIQGEIWAKAAISACVNPMTGILRIPNGKLLDSVPVSRMLSEICAECESVARAEGIRLPYRSMVRRVRAVVKDTANNHSSMLQDIERGRRTEIAQINGAFVLLGMSSNVKTPLNLTMLAMVESL